MIPVSFEFFPPNTPVGAERLRGVRAQLDAKRVSYTHLQQPRIER